VTFEGDVSESFDKRIELLQQRALLQEDQFATIVSSLDGLIEIMQNDLLSRETSFNPL
jgi:hypothetical protein